MDWTLTYTQKNKKDNYMKMVQIKTLLVIPNKVMVISFSEVTVNVNDAIQFQCLLTCSTKYTP